MRTRTRSACGWEPRRGLRCERARESAMAGYRAAQTLQVQSFQNLLQQLCYRVSGSTKVDTMGCNKKDRHTEAQVRAERNGQDSSCPYVTYRNFAQSENGGFNTSWGKRYSSLAGEENPPKRFVARVIIEPLSCDALSRRAHRGEGGRVQPPRGSFHV